MWIKKNLIYYPKQQWGWDYSHATLPVIDALDDKLRIYYSCRDRDNLSRVSFIDVEKDNPDKVIYVHNEPILELGYLGAFDEFGIMPTSIITVGDCKFLYYIGWSVKKSVPFDNHTGIAISRNGGPFEKLPGPVLGKDMVDPYFTGTFFVMKDEDCFRGYYMSGVEWVFANNRSEPKYMLKYAESDDGINWNKKSNCIELLDGEAGICQASVLKRDNQYEMWFSHRRMGDYRTDPIDSYRVGYAISSDGVSWHRSSNKTLNVSLDGWDSEMVCSPCVFDSGKDLYMFYNGNSFGKTGFGYAVWKE